MKYRPADLASYWLAKKRNRLVIDIAVPRDAGITDKEREKIEKYQDIRREVAHLWDIKTCVVPVVVGLLGMVTKNLANWHHNKDRTPAERCITRFARILRNVLEA